MPLPTADISKFELEVDARDGGRRKYKLRRSDAGDKAKVTRYEAGGERLVERGKRAAAETERLLEAIAPHQGMDQAALLDATCRALLLHKDDIHYLDVEVEFTSRTELQAGIAGRHAARPGKGKTHGRKKKIMST